MIKDAIPGDRGHIETALIRGAEGIVARHHVPHASRCERVRVHWGREHGLHCGRQTCRSSGRSAAPRTRSSCEFISIPASLSSERTPRSSGCGSGCGPQELNDLLGREAVRLGKGSSSGGSICATNAAPHPRLCSGDSSSTQLLERLGGPLVILAATDSMGRAYTWSASSVRISGVCSTTRRASSQFSTWENRSRAPISRFSLAKRTH